MLLLLPFLSFTFAGDILQTSILVFRHGDRTPFVFIPTDIYNSSSWPGAKGPGQLTSNGKEQLLRAGEFFKARYLDPLKDTYLDLAPGYKSDEVYVRSTDTDRTIGSARCFLAGFFSSPGEGNNVSSSIDVCTSIVPVHTVPEYLDSIAADIGGYRRNCPSYVGIRREAIFNNQEFLDFMKENSSGVMKILEIAGVELKNPSDLIEMVYSVKYPVFDSLQREISAGLPLKEEFAHERLYHSSKSIFELMLRTDYGPHMTNLKKSLDCGRFLREVKQRVIATAEGHSDAKKLVVYVTHDVTLSALLTCLGVYDLKMIPTATAVMLEVWEGEDGELSVAVSRYHEGDGVLEYTLPGCGNDRCTLESFLDVNTQLELTEEQFRTICDRDIIIM